MTEPSQRHNEARILLWRAKRATRAAGATAVAGVLVAVAGFVLAAILNVNSTDACIGCGLIFLLGLFLGFCALVTAAGLGVYAGWLSQQASHRRALDHSNSPSPAVSSFGLTPTDRRPRPAATDDLPDTDRYDLEGAKRRATTAMVLGIVGLFTGVTAPFAIWQGWLANQTFRRFPEHAKAFGRGRATAGIVMACLFGINFGLVLIRLAL